jgi:hypothetical protein
MAPSTLNAVYSFEFTKSDELVGTCKVTKWASIKSLDNLDNIHNVHNVRGIQSAPSTNGLFLALRVFQWSIKDGD